MKTLKTLLVFLIIIMSGVNAFSGNLSGAGTGNSVVLKSSSTLPAQSSSPASSAGSSSDSVEISIAVVTSPSDLSCQNLLRHQKALINRPTGFFAGLMHAGRMLVRPQYRRLAPLFTDDYRGLEEERRNALKRFLQEDINDTGIPKDLLEEIFVMNLHLLSEPFSEHTIRDASVTRADAQKFMDLILKNADSDTLARMMSLKVSKDEPNLKNSENPWLQKRRKILYSVMWRSNDMILEFLPITPRTRFFNNFVLDLTAKLDARMSTGSTAQASNNVRQLSAAFFDSLTLDEQRDMLGIKPNGQLQTNVSGGTIQDHMIRKVKNEIFVKAFSLALPKSPSSDLSALVKLIDKHNEYYFTDMGIVDYPTEKLFTSFGREENMDQAKFETEFGAVVYKLLRYRILRGIQNPVLSGYDFKVMAEEGAMFLKLLVHWSVQHQSLVLTEAAFQDIYKALQLTGVKSRDERTRMQQATDIDPATTADRLAYLSLIYGNPSLARAVVDASRSTPHNIFEFIQDQQPMLNGLISATTVDDVRNYFLRLINP